MTKEDVLRITLQKVKENLKNNEITVTIKAVRYKTYI